MGRYRRRGRCPTLVGGQRDVGGGRGVAQGVRAAAAAAVAVGLAGGDVSRRNPT